MGERERERESLPSFPSSGGRSSLSPSLTSFPHGFDPLTPDIVFSRQQAIGQEEGRRDVRCPQLLLFVRVWGTGS